MTSIAENITQVLTRVREAEQQHGRSLCSVHLLAVSKTRPAEDVRQAYVQGVRDFGENYLQDAMEKIEALVDLEGIRWHFIGSLQSNKTRVVAENFHWVHSIDRLKIAKRLHEQRPANMPPLNICIQVNISAEANKSGIHPDQVEQLVKEIGQLTRLRLRGLMAIPVATGDAVQQLQMFGDVKALFKSLKTTAPEMDTLSMGMSLDMDAAIAQGSTIVRIGAAIFGPRAY